MFREFSIKIGELESFPLPVSKDYKLHEYKAYHFDKELIEISVRDRVNKIQKHNEKFNSYVNELSQFNNLKDRSGVREEFIIIAKKIYKVLRTFKVTILPKAIYNDTLDKSFINKINDIFNEFYDQYIENINLLIQQHSEIVFDNVVEYGLLLLNHCRNFHERYSFGKEFDILLIRDILFSLIDKINSIHFIGDNILQKIEVNNKKCYPNVSLRDYINIYQDFITDEWYDIVVYAFDTQDLSLENTNKLRLGNKKTFLLIYDLDDNILTFCSRFLNPSITVMDHNDIF